MNISLSYRAWVNLGVMLSLLVLACLIYPAQIQTLSNKWLLFDESYGHGFFIIGLIAFELIKRAKLLNLQVLNIKNASGCLLGVSGCYGISYVAALHEIELAAQFAFYGTWVFLLAGAFSFRVWIILFFPLTFFIFAIPIWDLLNPFLVNLTSAAVSSAVEPLRLVVYIEENIIEMPFGTLVIADSCSGLRYLIVGLAIAVYALKDSQLPFLTKVKMFALAAVLSVVANWLRVFALVLIAYYSDMKSSLVADHDGFGIIVFFIIFLPFFPLLTKLEKRTIPHKS